MKDINTIRQLRKIEQRLAVLEERAFKKDKVPKATKAQKILLMKYTGILDAISNLNLSQNKKALLVSTLLDLNADNVEKDLSQIGTKKSALDTESNYNFLTDFFEVIGLEKEAKATGKELIKLRQQKKD